MTLLAITYCTLDDVERYLSATGVLDYADNDADGSADDGVTDDAINQATVEIDLYAQQRYSATGLSGSTLINRWCTRMAAYFLCGQRANPIPDTVALEFERIAGDGGKLEKIASGKLQLPGVALKADLSPSFSNLTVDRRHRRSTIRVTKVNSSDSPTKLTQDEMQERVVIPD